MLIPMGQNAGLDTSEVETWYLQWLAEKRHRRSWKIVAYSGKPVAAGRKGIDSYEQIIAQREM